MNEEEEERIAKILKEEKTTNKIAIPEQYKNIVEDLRELKRDKDNPNR